MFLHADSENSDQSGRMSDWSESSLHEQVILLLFFHAAAHLV